MSRRISKHLSSALALMAALVSLSLSGPLTHAAPAQAPDPGSLMGRMTGDWVMTGTIGKQRVTHDVSAGWILDRRYLRIHEVSRRKGVDGVPAYEAWIHIAWDRKLSEYAVMWLDNTGTSNFSAEGVGHGKPVGDRIPFVWRSADGSGIHNTFAYHRANDTWTWSIDNVDASGKATAFARLTLRRK